MYRFLRSTLLLAVLGGLVLQSAEAQGGRRGLVEVKPRGLRHGFWLSGGMGYGQESYRFGNEAFSEELGKPVFSLRLGGTPDEHLRLGGELSSWVNPYTDDEGFDITETLNAVSLVGQFYPIRTAGLFLKGGVGIGATAASVAGGNTTTETGFMVQYGAGYDIRLGRSLALTPTVELARHRFTQRNEPTLHERLLTFGIALTYQP